MTNLRDALNYQPNELQFGTSGLRGLASDMTDLECYINTTGFLKFLKTVGEVGGGGEVYIAGDLRDSTPRILLAVNRAVADAGYKPVYCGLIPTPALSLYGFSKGRPSIMVTGSHIPANRNGIKFIKPHDEVLKDDEAAIKSAVASVRAAQYGQGVETAAFDTSGMQKISGELATEIPDARDLYFKRFTDVFDDQTLAGKKIVFYQHSAVGRDLLPELFEALGAQVERVGRSDVFIPIDSENVKPEDEVYFRKLADEYPDTLAIVSTDGDSDRPFVIDGHGTFHRGDMLGVVVAEWLKADFAAYPISASDAADARLTSDGIKWKHTRIGSPFVVSAMKEALAAGKRHVAGWEVNGGFLTGSEIHLPGGVLAPLPTRDAFVAILGALETAVSSKRTVSAVFEALPQRFTQAGLINDFPVDVSREIKRRFSEDNEETRHELEQYFTSAHGFGHVKSINSLDGVRIYFDNGDIAHMRPSGNAPQLRIYGIADSQERADEIVRLALAEPDGIFRKLQADISKTKDLATSY